MLIRPRSIIYILLAIGLSALFIYFFSYVQWRRIVIPLEICLTGIIGLKIASQIRQASFSRVIRTASIGIVTFSAIILIGSLIDNMFFTDIGYAMFTVIAIMWLWIPFQLARLHARLIAMPDHKKRIITESTDIIYAQMTHREKELKAVLDQYNWTKQKLGINSTYVH